MMQKITGQCCLPLKQSNVDKINNLKSNFFQNKGF